MIEKKLIQTGPSIYSNFLYMLFALSILVCSIYDDPELQAAYNVIIRQVPESGN